MIELAIFIIACVIVFYAGMAVIIAVAAIIKFVAMLPVHTVGGIAGAVSQRRGAANALRDVQKLMAEADGLTGADRKKAERAICHSIEHALGFGMISGSKVGRELHDLRHTLTRLSRKDSDPWTI